MSFEPLFVFADILLDAAHQFEPATSIVLGLCVLSVGFKLGGAWRARDVARSFVLVPRRLS